MLSTMWPLTLSTVGEECRRELLGGVSGRLLKEMVIFCTKRVHSRLAGRAISIVELREAM